jgi:hypothetical protein
MIGLQNTRSGIILFLVLFIFISSCSRISQPISSRVVGFEIGSHTITNVDEFDKLYEYKLRVDTLITDPKWNKRLVRELSRLKRNDKDTSCLREFRIGCVFTYKDLSTDTLLLNVDKDVFLNGFSTHNQAIISEILIGTLPK